MKIWIVLFATLISFHVISCDVCGGVSIPSTQGLMPGNQFHFFGLRSGLNLFETGLTHTEDAELSNEYFSKTSIHGRWQFAKRFDGTADLPFQYNMQQSRDEKRSKHGIGDIGLAVGIHAISKENLEKETKHFLRFQIGAKLPTGAYAEDPWETDNLFPGTGSVDITLGTYYSFTGKKLGVIQENAFVYKTENRVGYRFGHGWLSRVNLFYRSSFENGLLIMPLAGATLFYSGQDAIYGIPIANSFNSSRILSAELGLTGIYKTWMLNLRGSLPLLQTISNGEARSMGSVELGVSYLIQKK